jgi:translation initiation factor 2D
MFKKPVKVSAQNQLSGKDRKTMKNKLSETFDEGCVDKIFNLNDKIISCKISGSKMIIYNGNDYPIFVDGTGKNDYFPSLYAVMAFEPLLKFVDLNEGVESYIYNGANLMWPGVRDFKGL